MTTRRAAEVQISQAIAKLVHIHQQAENANEDWNSPRLVLVRRNHQTLYDMSSRLESAGLNARYHRSDV